MINHFTFNGTSTAQLGLIVSGVSIFGAGSRKVEKAGIPGRNGDLQIELGGFNNYTVRYTVSITNDFNTTAQQIREWLLESKGYCELTDTYHPDEIRKACFNSDIEFTTSMLYKYGQASIQFDCLPERYLTTNTPITTTATADTTKDTTMSLSTVPTPIKITLNGNTTQAENPTPTNPQVIHNVSGDNTVTVCSFNVWDEEYELGGYSGTGLPSANTDRIRSKNTQPINVLGDTVYYFKSPQTVYIRWYDEYDNFIRSTDALNTTKRSPVTAKYLRFFIDPAYGTTYKHDICINVSNAQKNGTYEPYTRQSYPLYLPVENLFDFSTLANLGTNVEEIESGYSFTVSGTQFSTGAPITVNSGLLYIKCKIKNVTGKNLRVRVGYTDNTYNEAEGSGQTTGEWFNFSMTTSESKTVNKILFNWSTWGIFEVKDFIVSYHNTVNYYPYGTTPIELNKIGTYQDYIYKNGGKWYVHKDFNKIDMGTLTWQYSSNYAFFLANITNRKQGSDGMLCTFYPYGGYKSDSGMSTATDKTLYRDGSTSTIIKVKDTSYTDARTFKTAMSGALLYYPLQTATNTEITDTTLINQLNNIEKAYSYNGTTNILQVSNDNGFMLEVVSLHGSTFNSNYKGEPIITANATGFIYLNGELMEVLSAPVTINCQTMQCYNGVVNMNNEVRVNDFPEIKIGANEIGSSMALTITPNNWRH